MMDSVDLLKSSEWVALKPKPFHVSCPQPKLVLTVAWNNIQGRLAITCQERHRVAGDTDSAAWAGIFTLKELEYVHRELCLVHPDLDKYFPVLPAHPTGIWAVLYNVEVTDEQCVQVQRYLQMAVDLCGKDLLVHTLFDADSPTLDQYLEDLEQLRMSGYQSAYEGRKHELEEVHGMRSRVDNLIQMTQIYSLENQALDEVLISLTELYHYQLHPFLSLRECAYTCMRDAKAILESPHYGQRVRNQAAAELKDWQTQYSTATQNIHNLYVQYYNKTAKLFQAQVDCVTGDQKRFGKASFELYASEVLNERVAALYRERIKLSQSLRAQAEYQRDKKEQELAFMSSSDVIRLVDHVEAEVYDLQIKVMDIKLETLNQEEKLIKWQLSHFKKKHQEDQEEGVFHDAVEDTSLLLDERVEVTKDPRVVILDQQLKAIYRGKAGLRNKRNLCTAQRGKLTERRQTEKARYVDHHQVARKREEKKKEANVTDVFVL